IRIPRLEDFAPGSDVIYLKDRQEFLRRPTPPPRGAQAPDAVQDLDELALTGDHGDGQAVALETLALLQQLCSLEFRIDRHLETLDKGGVRETAGHDRATLQRYRALVRQARLALDEELRQRLMELNDQLFEANDEI